VFPVDQRPVFIENVVNVTKKTELKAWPLIAEEVGEIVDRYPGRRILVHTVSYKLTEHIYQSDSTGRMLTYWNAKERERVLAEFLDTDDGVLLAPSFERGVDLPGEDCEVIIIAKIPYPYLGDKQVKARLYSRGGQSWYAVQTIRTIAQMTGRGMRSAEDWCDAYILDGQFRRLWRDHKRLFPKWWSEALVLSKTDPRYRHLIDARDERLDTKWVARR